MAKERLSKLQRYILFSIYDFCWSSRMNVKKYFNKEEREAFSDSERVVVNKSYKSLLLKGLILKGKRKSYILTTKGVETLKLKANELPARRENISFKDYNSRLKQKESELKKYIQATKQIFQAMGLKK